MGRFQEHDIVTTEAHAFGEPVGSAARMLRHLHPVDLQDAWQFAELQAAVALHAWFSASEQERSETYTAYVAALDREEAAAGLLESRLALSAGEGF